MTRIKMTDREKMIVKALVRMSKTGRDTFSLDWMCMEVFGGEPSLNQRHTMAATLRNFVGKLYQAGGYRLKRTSELGHGNKGEYEFAGDFERLLNQEAA